MPLQCRVDPVGRLFADFSRGTYYGNRGGRFHRDNRTLNPQQWASRQWICCVLEFKGRHRPVWGSRGLTSLFFLDEVTALSAGHRPCFECRRMDAKIFAGAWQQAFNLVRRPRVDEMDRILHAERLYGRAKRLHRRDIDGLPDGTFVMLEEEAWGLRGGMLLRWTSQGYDVHKRRLRGANVDVLTPPAIVGALAAGYRPQWHPSVDKLISSPP